MTQRQVRWPIKSDGPAVLAGLAAAQAVSLWAVRQSNLKVHQDAVALQDAGWLSVPAGPARALLLDWGAAFGGGLFFTLTVGAALALSFWALIRVWRRYRPQSRRWFIAPAAAAAMIIIFVNSRGWVWFPTLLVLAVLLCSGSIAGISGARPQAASRGWVPLAALALLSSVWATQLNPVMFINIRDHLLLTNPVGARINDFYYRNTLYAAELFKSFRQKSLHTCHLEGSFDPLVAERLIAALSRQDMLAIPGQGPVDLIVRLPLEPMDVIGLLDAGRPVDLITRSGRRLKADLAALSADPGPWLDQISELDDRWAPFRRLTFLGLLIGFPVLLYWIVYGLIRRLIGYFVPGRQAEWWAAGSCLAIGGMLLAPLLFSCPVPVTAEDINSVFETGPWTRRVTAMRQIEKNRWDIARFPAYRQLLHDSMPVERYYLARALALSQAEATYLDLTGMIDDAHPNVVCQVIYALGRRGHPTAAALITHHINLSDHWYVQWYGYRALRNLGWRQNPSVSPP